MNATFGIRFLFSNIAISILIIAIFFIKKLFKKHISFRTQYNIWFLLLLILIVPFLPIKPMGIEQIYSWLTDFESMGGQNQNASIQSEASSNLIMNTNWMQDFSISVSRETPHFINTVLIAIWLIGIIIMLGLTIYSNQKIKQLKLSALPMQNQKVRFLYEECKKEVGIKRSIPIFSSAYLRSPVTIGLFKPCIILPIHLISDFKHSDIRYILLHELQHYKHKDLLINLWMCLTRVIYWFHPLIWYALKEMRNDCEIACDISVLHMLDEDYYTDYGNTLINFAETISHGTFTSVAGIGGTKKQIKKRIISIVSFKAESRWLKVKSILVYLLIGIIIIGFVPILSIGAATKDIYKFSDSNTKVEDLSYYFKNYNGSFVLYEQNTDNYIIYNEEGITKRVSPDSTYKIFSGLFALESGNILPDSSTLYWDNTTYQYDAWNQNQTLNSAMKNSVNWYFQSLDSKTGMYTLQKYFNIIEYGNKDLSGGLSKYWMESTLKISPMEQVELLRKFYYNDFQFEDINVQAIKDALLLSDSNDSNLYGKTGTGNVEGKNINGWFIGFIETYDNTYFFATNIQNDDNCTGSIAANITLSILKEKNIYSQE